MHARAHPCTHKKKLLGIVFLNDRTFQLFPNSDYLPGPRRTHFSVFLLNVCSELLMNDSGGTLALSVLGS